MPRSRLVLGIVGGTALLAAAMLAGCSSSTSSSGSSSSDTSAASAPGSFSGGSAAAGCDPASLATAKAGELTIATSEPVYEPWMVDNDPTNGKGFESAVAYAVADQLGYGTDKVTWTRVGFNEAIANRTAGTSTSISSPSPPSGPRWSTSPPATTTSPRH